jgi:hypothetical protein
VTPALTPVKLEAQGDQLRATLTVTSRTDELAVVAHLTVDGRVIDLQTTGRGGRWLAGTTGDSAIDELVVAALEAAYVAAENAAAFNDVRWRVRRRGRRQRW